METTKLKRFATEARINLMEGVKKKLRLLGFDANGHAVNEPQLVQGATLWKGEEYPEDFYSQWKTLQQRLSEKDLREVAEEAAYTWFNRMMAIRILSMNGFCEPILRIDPSTGLPNLLANARMGRIPEMNIHQKNRFEILMDDDTKTYEQFSLLLTVWCHDNPIINACFGSINDYVELLLPDNILRPDGFLSLLNETDFISEEDYKSAELIGWLYQFYISDRKDEVIFGKGIYKIEEVPAATQLFTPNWIVKYLVQNSILSQVDSSEEIIDKAKYLVKVEGADNLKIELENLKVADLACGSGHILNECFDLLFELYRSEAYSRKEAIVNIFTKNITGIDIDLRAKQLATFSLLLKACQKDESFIDAHCLPNILGFPEIDRYDWRDTGGHFACAYQIDYPEGYSYQEIDDAFSLLKNANSLGSIIKFNISSGTQKFLKDCIDAFEKNPLYTKEFLPLVNSFKIILALTSKYNAIIMNPPYLGRSHMHNSLKLYVEKNYKENRSDLFEVFLRVSCNLLSTNGVISCLTPFVWLFIPSFKNIRDYILKEFTIDSLIQLEYNAFEPACVPVIAFCIRKGSYEYEGSYIRLVDFKGHQNQAPKTLEAINNHKCGWFYKTHQRIFHLIPGRRITGFWASKKMLNAFKDGKKLEDKGVTRKGMYTGLNDRFVRNWFEINYNELALGFTQQLSENSNKKWYPYANGGICRKWYGNYWDVVFWQYNGTILRTERNEDGKIRAGCFNLDYIFKQGVVWNSIGSSSSSMRLMCKGSLFSSASNGWFGDNPKEILGLLNSKVSQGFLDIINPTMNANPGDLALIPIIESKKDIEIYVDNCLNVSKADWDSHETSWDFETNELVRNKIEELRIKNIEGAIQAYKEKWTEKFFQLHKNEEELNRQFIEIYGLQDELTPDVPMEEITILQQGEIKVEDGKINWNEDILIKQLISYIVGVYMGRYRLDKPGLHIAYPNPSDEDLAPYDFSITHHETMTIDTDAIIPVLPKDAPFYDNLYNYVVEFIGKVWGQEALTENLNFIEKALRKSLEDYLMKDFWKDHKKMYQNRPIYWEFASKKGAFKAIIYAHRMDKYTIEVLRSKYVLPFIKHIENKISNLESREQELSTKERRELDNLRTKILPELEDYHARVEQMAAETAARPQVFDLDDGIPHNHSLFGDIVTKLK